MQSAIDYLASSMFSASAFTLSASLRMLGRMILHAIGWPGVVAVVAGGILALSMSAKAMKFLSSGRGMAATAAVLAVALAIIFWPVAPPPPPGGGGVATSTPSSETPVEVAALTPPTPEPVAEDEEEEEPEEEEDAAKKRASSGGGGSLPPLQIPLIGMSAGIMPGLFLPAPGMVTLPNAIYSTLLARTSNHVGGKAGSIAATIALPATEGRASIRSKQPDVVLLGFSGGASRHSC